MGGECSTYGKIRVAYRILMGKPEGKRPLGRPTHRYGIILRWISKKWNGCAWAVLIWLRIGTGGWFL
jgi:hypothetical protein